MNVPNSSAVFDFISQICFILLSKCVVEGFNSIPARPVHLFRRISGRLLHHDGSVMLLHVARSKSSLTQRPLDVWHERLSSQVQIN